MLIIQTATTKRWALIYSGLIFPKDTLSLASENGMFCLWEWNVLTQVCVGSCIHALGWREDTVEGILFWDCQDSRHNMALSNCTGFYHFCECAPSRRLSLLCVLTWLSHLHIQQTFEKHLSCARNTKGYTHKHKRNCKQMLNSS